MDKSNTYMALGGLTGLLVLFASYFFDLRGAEETGQWLIRLIIFPMIAVIVFSLIADFASNAIFGKGIKKLVSENIKIDEEVKRLSENNEYQKKFMLNVLQVSRMIFTFGIGYIMCSIFTAMYLIK